MFEALNEISGSTAPRFDLTSGPYCVTCSKNVPEEACALQCIAERSASADPRGNLAQRLRLRVRCLEKELASLAALRSEHYQKKIKETEEQCKSLLKWKDDEQSAWYATELDERKKLRAGATLMFHINVAKQHGLVKQMDEQRLHFEANLRHAKEDKERCKAESEAELERLQRDHALTCASYDARLRLLEEKKDQAEEFSRKRQEIVESQRNDISLLREERETHTKEIEKLQRQLADADRAIEEMQRDTRIKAIQRRAQKEKESLETEVMDYVRYILCTPEGRSATPDFPWEWLGNPNLTKIAMERKQMPIPPSKPAVPMGFQRRTVSPTSTLPVVRDAGTTRSVSAMGFQRGPR